MTRFEGDCGHEQRDCSLLTIGTFSFVLNTRCAAASGYYMSRGICGQDRSEGISSWIPYSKHVGT